MRVLLIEDSPSDTDLICHALSNGCSVTAHDNLTEALQQKDLAAFDVALCDLTLPDASGIECVERLTDAAPDLPIVLLTGCEGDEVALQTLNAGAQDFLVKQDIFQSMAVATITLKRALSYAVQRQHSVSQQQQLVKELQVSQTLLEQKNKRLADLCDTAQKFVDNVSHEFRTPLTVIKEYASLIRDGIVGEVNEQQHQMLNVIEDRGDDLNNMVDDMLDVSKIEADMVGAWRKACTLPEIVDHIMPALERKAAVRDVAFEVDLPTNLPEVWCDAEKAGRVIINLVVNAIKFCGEKGKVRLWAESDPVNQEVTLRISDNGPGIPSDQLASIFERFSQPVTSVRQSTKGFGLGLGIAKELVDLNLGQMSIESTEGIGSTFGFSLPHNVPAEVLKRQLSKIRNQHGAESEICCVEVSIDPAVCDRDRRDAGILLQQGLRMNDQVFAGEPDHWLLVLHLPAMEIDGYLQRLQDEHQAISRNRPNGPLPLLAIELRGQWRLGETNPTDLIGLLPPSPDSLLSTSRRSTPVPKELSCV